MKKNVMVWLLLSAFYAAAAQEKPLFTKPLTASVTTIESETSGGNIMVTGGTGELRAELYAAPANGKHKNISEAEIKERLNSEYEVKFEVEGNRLIANARRKKRNGSWNNGLSISFKIYAPRNVSATLSTSGGNIELKGIEGTQDFVTSGGNLALEDLGGKITGTTSGGNISIHNGRDEIGLSTSGGNVEAKDCSGKLRLTTSGGNIELERLKGSVDATTSGGNISGAVIEGTLKASTSGGNIQLSDLLCSVDASTSGGEILVKITKLTDHIRLSNSGGNVKLILPKNAAANLKLTGDHVSTDHMENFSGKIDKEMVEGKLNGGGPEIRIRSDGGNVALDFK